MDRNKHFLKLWFPLDNNVVTKVGIEFVHNLSNKPRDITNWRTLTLILNLFLFAQSPKIV